MELKRCTRCGKFYASEVEVCQDCERKDLADLSKLKVFFEEEFTNSATKVEISNTTGISAKNLNRYLGYEEFSEMHIPETLSSFNNNETLASKGKTKTKTNV